MKKNERKVYPELYQMSFAFFFQGYVPMYVNATAGTTVYGAFDPINEIADICEKYNMWLHVDVRKYSHCLATAVYVSIPALLNSLCPL